MSVRLFLSSKPSSLQPRTGRAGLLGSGILPGRGMDVKRGGGLHFKGLKGKAKGGGGAVREKALQALEGSFKGFEGWLPDLEGLQG